MIPSLMPIVGVGHSEPLVTGPDPESLALLCAIWATFCFDYLARQKLGGVNFTFGYLKQIPVPNLESQETPWGKVTRQQMSAIASELGAVSWDLAGLAGTGRPYKSDPDRRFALMVELNALVFHLYGVERDDVGFIIDTFPIVRKRDEAEHGEYRTKRLILKVYDCIAEAIAGGEPYETALNPPPADLSLCHERSTRPDWAEIYEQLEGNAK